MDENEIDVVLQFHPSTWIRSPNKIDSTRNDEFLLSDSPCVRGRLNERMTMTMT